MILRKYPKLKELLLRMYNEKSKNNDKSSDRLAQIENLIKFL
jgi:hypothetical protein